MASSQPRALGIWIDRLVAILLVLNLAWTVWHLGGVLASPMAVSYAVLMFTLAWVVLRWLVIEPTGLPRGWWWPMPMTLYVVAHVQWVAVAPGRAWLDGLHWGWLAAGYLVGLHVVRVRSARGIVWAGVAMVTMGLVLLACYQRWVDVTWLPSGRTQVESFHTRSGGAFGAPNSLAAWMILVLPIAGAIVWRGRTNSRWSRWAAYGVLAGGSLALLVTYSRGGWIALAGALLVWPLIMAGRWGEKLKRLSIVGGLLGAVAGATYWLVSPARERIDRLVEQSGELTRPIMWRVAWESFLDARWLGWGGRAYEVVFERYRPFWFWDEPKWAHNDYLNTLSDYGIWGFVLSFGMVGFAILTTIRRRTRLAENVDHVSGVTGAMAVGGLAVALGMVVDFHIRIPALSLLIGLVAADGQTRLYRPKRTLVKRWGIPLGCLSAIALLVFGTIGAVPVLQSEGIRFFAREQIDGAVGVTEPEELKAVVAPTLAALEEAVRLFPSHEQAWSDLAYARSLRVNWEPDKAWSYGVEAEQAARRALGLCDQNWESWVRLGTSLDLQDRWSEAGLAFGTAVKLASNSSEAWYYQAFHLSLKPTGMPVAKAALATCLRLDPWNPDGEALRALLERELP